MKSAWLNIALGVALAGGVAASSARAEDGIKALPTLLIKGEVVSLDTTDPSAELLKVKDRYGFETPIFLTSETKITQGDAPLGASSLAAGTAVEVEYNFDVNTAKRHAVSVKVPAPVAEPAASETLPAPAVEEPAPAEPAAPEAPAAPAAEEPAPAEPVLAEPAPMAEPAAPEAPAAPAAEEPVPVEPESAPAAQ